MVRLVVFFTLLGFGVGTCLAQNEAPKEGIPHYPEWLYKKRLTKLNDQTPIVLDYNDDVKAYIDVYTVKRRGHLSNIIALSDYYFPLFEEYLAKYNLPLELKYLAVIESALDPKAKSTSGAMGLWQFLYHAAKMFDLKIESYVDERCDPILATEAACKYLQYLYLNFNDWQLALAAYNGGIGVVKKAIIRSGGKTNYWELRPYLPEQVKGYVPAFIAANYALNYYDMHSIVPSQGKLTFNEVDTVYIHKSVSFDQLANATGVDRKMLEWLNPKYIKNFIPVRNNAQRIFIPGHAVDHFLENEDALYEPIPTKGHNELIGCTKGRKMSYYTVESGEYFHKVAMKYQCRIEDIMLWNKMETKDLFAGQVLMVWELIDDTSAFFVRHEVQKMDTKIEETIYITQE